MASFGKVLNLLDDRYLNLQDVTGHVEPFCTLVPYEKYTQNVLVYRMDTNHEIFMGLIQDFTARMSREFDKELWTWCTQWEVKRSLTPHLSLPPPIPKKLRIDMETPGAHPNLQLPQNQRKPQALTTFDRRCLNRGPMQEEQMLRILIDIVQVESMFVPNFVEFLYQWIDYFEGDGKALQAALKWEIPSLWDFDYHPLVLPKHLQKKVEEGKEGATNTEAEKGTVEDSKEASKINEQKKERQKPDLVAMERKVEENERLQYREVRYGMPPPRIENLPLPPLINIPLDRKKRVKYYAACFKCRQRALLLLLEAGLTIPLIGGYKKLQEEHPKNTPLVEGDNSLHGLRNYFKEAPAAQQLFRMREKQMLLRQKQREVSISNKLASEAQLATQNAAILVGANVDGDHVGHVSLAPPLIPLTPTSRTFNRPDAAVDILEQIKAMMKKYKENTIQAVPASLAGRMKSKMFADTTDRTQLANRSIVHPPTWLSYRASSSEYDEDEDGYSDFSDNDDDDDDPMDGVSSASYGVLPSQSAQPPISTANIARPTNVTDYMRDLDPSQANHLLPFLNNGSRQAVEYRTAASDLPNQPQPPILLADRNRLSHFSNMPTSTRGTTLSQFTTYRDPSPIAEARDASSPASSTALPRPPALSITVPTQPQALNVDPPLQEYAYTPSGRRIPIPPNLRLPLTSPNPHEALNGSGDSQGSVHIPTNSNSTNPQTARTPVSPAVQRYLAAQIQRGLFAQTQVSQPAPIDNAQIQMPLGSMCITQSNTIQQQHIDYGQLHASLNRDRSISQGEAVAQPASAQQLLNSQEQQNRAERSQTLRIPGPASSDILDSMIHPSIQQLMGRQQQQGDARTQQIQPPTLSVRRRLTATNPDPQQADVPNPPSIQIDPNTIPRPQAQHSPLPGPHQSSFSQPQPGIQRNTSSLAPLSIPSSPLSSLPSQLTATSPFATSPNGIPIQVYIPKVVLPALSTTLLNAKAMGDGNTIETDALMLGYTYPGSTTLTLTKAILLPVGVWQNTLRRVRVGAYTVLETYSPPPFHPALSKGKAAVHDPAKLHSPHKAIYEKLAQAYGLMVACEDREEEVTKRWRVTKGPMTERDRGSVWEGWGVVLDREIEMSGIERSGAGATISYTINTHGEDRRAGEEDTEMKRRLGEMEELIDGDEENGDTMEE